ARQPSAPRRDPAPSAVPGPPSGLPGASAAEGGRPAPLPMRGARPQRPTPAEALPGVRPEHRPTVDGNTSVPPTPRGGTVRGTMGKPQLPRRRAHEHLAPQLRGGPTPLPRPDADQHVGHDPGLMAAFQRGIGLAEAAAHRETDQGDTGPVETGHREAGLGDAGVPAPPDAHTRLDVPAADVSLTDVSLTDVSPVDVSPADVSPADVTDQGVAHLRAADLDGRAMEGAHMDAAHMDVGHTTAAHMDAGHMTAAHREAAHWDGPSADVRHIGEARSAHASAHYEARGTRESAPAPDRTARHDGSTPAG
ncbi:MAG: hypothetical protein QOC85_3377, partial [Streptomyces sp.]|nr:hypothetical protein [Streptomyces sp.]